jgi:AAA domain
LPVTLLGGLDLGGLLLLELALALSLDRVQGRDGYVLSGRDDDIVVNVSLREKLREFKITLPEISEGDDWTPSDYFILVGQAVSPQRRFEADRSAIGLGFFTFSKFMMWRDLDVDVWPNGGLIEHTLLGTLLGEGGEFENEPPIVLDDEPIDHRIDLSTAIHVVDADSSQAVVIEEARSRRNLVVQGPPGTGKSQTITNIIAAAIHAGRSVLFIAEKTAALEVVHDRLKRAGLGALCLELHSRKSNKREVLKSLEESLRLSGSTRFDPAVASRLSACRDKLNKWSSIIHQPIGQSGRTPFDVIGAQLKLRWEQVRLLGERLDAVAEWSGEKIASAEQAIDRVPPDCPIRGQATRPMAGCALLSATAGAPRWLCSLSPLRPFTMMEAVSASSWRAGGAASRLTPPTITAWDSFRARAKPLLRLPRRARGSSTRPPKTSPNGAKNDFPRLCPKLAAGVDHGTADDKAQRTGPRNFVLRRDRH